MARIAAPPIQSPLFQNNVLAQVWSRWFRDLGRVTETVSTRGVIDVAGGDTYNLTEAGNAVNLIANVGNATVILPYATADNIGETVTVTLTDDTFNGIITPKTGETIIGETSIVMNLTDMTYDCMVLSTGKWVFI
jgi:hypothetical protein